MFSFFLFFLCSSVCDCIFLRLILCQTVGVFCHGGDGRSADHYTSIDASTQRDTWSRPTAIHLRRKKKRRRRKFFFFLGVWVGARYLEEIGLLDCRLSLSLSPFEMCSCIPVGHTLIHVGLDIYMLFHFLLPDSTIISRGIFMLIDLNGE